MQFLFGPVIGNLSDRYGRRPVMLVSLAVMAADYLVMAVAGSIWLLLAGRIVGGIAAATHSTANAFMADISAPHEKAARFGLVGAAFGAGFVARPAPRRAAGRVRHPRALLRRRGASRREPRSSGALVMPETLPDGLRRPFRSPAPTPSAPSRASEPAGGATAPVDVLPLPGRLHGLPGRLGLFRHGPIRLGATHDRPVARRLRDRHGGGPGRADPVILRYLGERNTVLYGLVFNFFVFLTLAFVRDGTVALILMPLTALGAVVTPALQGIMSRAAPDDAQGELQGVVSSTAALAMVVSPLIMTQVFAAFTAPGTPLYMPGAPFLVSMR
jgi:MFS transporter, DHA1 family, tetracycline resistance protein